MTHNTSPYYPPNIPHKNELCDIFFNNFSQLRNFVEEFKKGMKFLFFILMRGISGYFLLHTSAKNDYLNLNRF